MSEKNHHTQSGAASDADDDRATDPLRGSRPSEATSGGVPENSTEQTMQISRVDPPDEGLRSAMQAASATDRVPYERPEHDPERTQTIPAVQADTQQFSPASPGSEATTRSMAPAGATAAWGGGGGQPPGPPADPAGPGSGDGGKKSGGAVRAGVIAGIAAAALALLYIGDMVFSSGHVPRGTVVADVEIGGMTVAAAESELRNELSDSLDQPVRVRVGDAQTSIDPKAAGLEIDWAETVDRAGSQPWNPITRVTSLFTSREIAPVTHGDATQVRQAIEEVKPRLEREPAEGTIRFEGATPVAVDPVTGRRIDVEAATEAVIKKWAAKGAVALPFDEEKVSTTREGVQQALKDVAQPAVSAPVTVRGEGKDATLTPEMIATTLRFEPNGEGGLKSWVDVPAAVAAVQPQLADTMRPGKDAEIVLEGGAPVVRPSTDGHGIDWEKSFEKLADVYGKKDDRSVQALYRNEPPKFTTDQANQLGIREVVSEFTTGGFEGPSGVNIKRTAEQVNGAIIKPGETFSLNGHTGPRGVEQGYVESGIIQDGRPGKAVGGGISQFATTLFNASYFAGMKDVEHKEHSYYISRYPAGREATVFQSPDGSSIIDVKFKNTSDRGVMITTAWTPSSITVKFWSTKQFEVSSHIGERTNHTPPQLKVVPPGEPCSPSKGTPGFTVHDTRTIKNLKTGKVTTESPTKTVYDPQPIIHCNAAPPAPGAPAPPR